MITQYFVIFIVFYIRIITGLFNLNHLPTTLAGEFLGVIDAIREATVPSNFQAIAAQDITELVSFPTTRKSVVENSNAFVNSTVDFLPQMVLTMTLKLAGFPRPLIICLIALHASQAPKFFPALSKKKRGKLRINQVAGDITKWLIYDACLDVAHISSLDLCQQVEASVIFGCFSTIMGLVMRDVLNPKHSKRVLSMEMADYGRVCRRRYSAAVLEAALLFSTLTFCSHFLTVTVPPAYLNYDLPFDKLIEDTEELIQTLDGEIVARSIN
jgi:hypothetical protein